MVCLVAGSLKKKSVMEELVCLVHTLDPMA
jgi:hypothetical protein